MANQSPELRTDGLKPPFTGTKRTIPSPAGSSCPSWSHADKSGDANVVPGMEDEFEQFPVQYEVIQAIPFETPSSIVGRLLLCPHGVCSHIAHCTPTSKSPKFPRTLELGRSRLKELTLHFQCFKGNLRLRKRGNGVKGLTPFCSWRGRGRFSAVFARITQPQDKKGRSAPRSCFSCHFEVKYETITDAPLPSVDIPCKPLTTLLSTSWAAQEFWHMDHPAHLKNMTWWAKNIFPKVTAN